MSTAWKMRRWLEENAALVVLGFFVALPVIVWVILGLIMFAHDAPLRDGEMFDEHKAERAVRIFESLKHTKGRFYGEPFVLLPWERQIIREVYGRVYSDGKRMVKMVYLEIPKKQGKSEIAAAAGILHTFFDGERNGEVYGCAADRGQASLVFDVAVDMVDQSPFLRKRTHLQMSHRRMTDRASGTFYQVLSAESYTKHGLNVSACIFDELHAQPNRDLWDVMTFGAGDAREQPLWWVITTAGDDPDRVSVCWEQHEYAKRVLAGEVHDPSFYPVIYGYEGEDIYNEENWYTANPSLGTTVQIESLREAALKAKENPANERLFRWLRLNQWLTYKLTTWLPLELWDKTVGEWNRTELLGRDCYMGLDLSTTTDLSALALIFPPQGEQREWRVIWECWMPKENLADRVKNDHIPYDRWAESGWLTVTEGDVVDYTVIEETILRLNKLYHVVELDIDRTFAAMLVQRLEKQGMTVVDIPQTFVGLSDALNLTEILLKGKSPTPTLPSEAGEGGDGYIGADEYSGETPPQPSPPESIDGEGEIIPPLLINGMALSGKMTHENNPVARWCFGNTSVAKNGQGYLKYVKEHKGKSVDRTKRIDLTAAWVTAMVRARFYKGSMDLSAEILDPEWGL